MEELIIQEYKNGASSIKISKKYKISKSKVLKILKNRNVEIRTNKNILTKEQENKIIDLYTKNIDIETIKNEINVSKKDIYNTLTKFSVKRKTRNKISEKEKINICNDFLAGLKIIDILKKYNIKKDCTVYTILKKNGIQIKKVPHNKIDENTKNKIIQEYIDGLNICEIHEKYGFGTTTVARWLKEKNLTRTFSDAFSLSAIKGRKHFKGTNLPWFSLKTNKWFVADSMWEALRMEQLDNNDDVIYWEKCTERIPYLDENGKSHYYIPDFKIIYKDSHIEIEEIKPKNLLENRLNKIKINTAISFFSEKNIIFKVVTEENLGLENIKNFNPNCFIKYTKEIREKRKKQLRNEREKRKRQENNNNKKAI